MLQTRVVRFTGDDKPIAALSGFEDLDIEPGLWALVVVEAPWWASVPDEVYPKRPIVTLLWAGVGSEGDRLRLLRYAHYYPSDTTEIVASAAQDIVRPLEHIPSGCAPTSVSVAWTDAGAPHTVTFGSSTTTAELAQRITTVANGSLHASSSPHLRRLDATAARADGMPPALQAAVRAAMQWLRESSPALADMSDASWFAGVPARQSAVQAFMSLADTNLKVPAATVFLTGNQEWPSGLLVPAAALRRAPDLQRDHGPLPPGTRPDALVGIRLHRDVGDSLFLAERLRELPNPTASYRDWLHLEDGELVLTAVATSVGAAAADIEALAEWGLGGAGRVPRLYCQTLSGLAAKPSPLHAAELGLHKSAPDDAHVDTMLRAVETAVGFASTGIPHPPTVDAGVLPCKWCNRLRNNNKRCSACRTVGYCCPQHQQLDWKQGGHGKQCRAMKDHADSVQALFGGLPLPTTTPLAADAEVAAGYAAKARQHRGSSGERLTALFVYSVGLAASENLHELATEFIKFGGASDVDRVLVVSAHLPDKLDGTVIAASSSECRVVPSMGTLGDVWRDGGVNAIPEGQCRMRFCAGKLHHLSERGGNAGLPPRVDMVVCFGAGGDGLSFFDAYVRQVITMSSARHTAVVFTFESRRAALASVRVLHQALEATTEEEVPAPSRALFRELVPSDGRTLVARPSQAGRARDASRQDLFADAYALAFSL
jgi:hypothetical protein